MGWVLHNAQFLLKYLVRRARITLNGFALRLDFLNVAIDDNFITSHTANYNYIGLSY